MAFRCKIIDTTTGQAIETMTFNVIRTQEEAWFKLMDWVTNRGLSPTEHAEIETVEQEYNTGDTPPI